MSSWWCYIGFKDLYRAVYKREVSPKEQEEFKKLSQAALNQWVIDHIARTNGMYISINMKGYEAFTILPLFMKGIYDKDLVYPEGATVLKWRTSAGAEYTATITRHLNLYRIETAWNNNPNDRGITEITMNSAGMLQRLRSVRASLPYPIAYNFVLKEWFREGDTQEDKTSKHVSIV